MFVVKVEREINMIFVNNCLGFLVTRGGLVFRLLAGSWGVTHPFPSFAARPARAVSVLMK